MSTLPLHSARCVATLDETRAELRDASVFIRGHLIEIAANPKWLGVAEGVRGGTPAFSLVLHTWTQDLQRHIHLHAVMACGALGQDGPGWARMGQDGQRSAPARKPDFLFPVQALSKVFRGWFLAALAAAHQTSWIERDRQGEDGPWRARQRLLYPHDWLVHAKTPLGGPAQALEYLSRCTHRTTISNERIRFINEHEVAFTARADKPGGKPWLQLDGSEFVRRVMLHILPTGIKRIRHYGVLASARTALLMPPSNPQAWESAHAFMARVAQINVLRCPCCGQRRLRVTAVWAVLAVLAGLGRLPAPHRCGIARFARNRHRQTAQTSNPWS